MKYYIKLYATKPPGKSIAVDDLDNRPAIAAGDIPTAEWDVERADGTPARITGQQLIDAIGGTPSPGTGGRPAEIEIEDTADGIRIRGKSGDDAEFGEWHYVRDGKDGKDGTGSGETIYPVSSLLTPVVSRLGLVTVSRLRFVLSRLNPVPAKLNGLPLSRLGESEFRRKLSNPYERKLRSG